MNSSDWPPLTKELTLSRDVVHVVRIDLDAAPPDVTPLRSLLCAEELARADRYKLEAPRSQFIVCRAALRQLLGQALNTTPASVVFHYGPHGKPLVAWEPPGTPSESRYSEAESMTTLRPELALRPEFNVSHSGDVALIALGCGRRLGIDIERHDPAVKARQLARRFFSPREVAELESLPDSDTLSAFYRGWTGKEAYLKATGAGLSRSLASFSVSMLSDHPVGLVEVIDSPDEPLRWQSAAFNVRPQFTTTLMWELLDDDQQEMDVNCCTYQPA